RAKSEVKKFRFVPKMVATTPQKKAKASPKNADHPKYIEMIIAAIKNTKERNGCSRQAILKYIKANYKVSHNVELYLKLALRKDNAALVQVKGTGASGSFKLAKVVKEPKPKQA
ncbi:histone H1/H5 family protein, partial [Salmonella sp. s54412]|uniref:histone H1/H5 family protein n=1 Tax=Salmonella sp. s54412 TaxID=3160128 RepID=UPI003754BAD4